MKVFLDTADLGEIREGKALGIIDGVTTNPSLVAKAGCRGREEFNGVADEAIDSFTGMMTPGGPATLTRCPYPAGCS